MADEKAAPQLSRCHVLGVPISVLGWQEAIDAIAKWSAARSSRYICICNAHSVVTATRDPIFARVIEQADMATPDGAPVAWMMRRLGQVQQTRINGPDLMVRYVASAATRNESIYLLGGSEETLRRLRCVLESEHTGLRIAGAYSPPFRTPTPEEDAAIVEAINQSGAQTVWVGLGCPKQEVWMSEHRGRVRATMIGVGAAFDYIASTVPRAPTWMQHAGLEWLHRLATEPRRLWRRYLVTNSLFLAGAVRQLATQGRVRHGP